MPRREYEHREDARRAQLQPEGQVKGRVMRVRGGGAAGRQERREVRRGWEVCGSRVCFSFCGGSGCEGGN
jgi:hypothetical protein